MSPVQTVTHASGMDQNKDGWTGLPTAKNSDSNESRTIIYDREFYTAFNGGRKQLIFGERPRNLAEVQNITKRALEQHQTYLKRLENFPLAKAEYYKNLKETTGARSVRALSEITGEDWSYIAKVLRTLELPLPIQEFLRTHKDPEFIKRFHLSKLLELVQIKDEEVKLLRFRKML